MPAREGASGAAGAAPMANMPDASVIGNPTFPADWCSRLGGFQALMRLSNAYNLAVRMTCAIAGLTADSALSNEQNDEWRNYVRLYSSLMAGCVPNYEPPEGGISVFGPANTPYVGAARAKLSANEALLLTDAYVQAFGDELALSADERGAVRAYLLRVAQPEIDDAATGSLSTCGLDAGQ